MEEILKDERFSHIATDSSFRHIPKNVRKIKIDNRFKGMLKNKKLSKKCHVDERGRVLNLNSTENFKKHYDEDSSESDDKEKESRKNEKLSDDNELNTVKKDNKKTISQKTKKLHKNPKVSLNANNNFNKNEKANKLLSIVNDDRFKIESESSEESSSSEDEEQETIAAKKNEDSSSSSSDEESSESDDSCSKQDDSFDHQWEEQQERAPDTDEITKRLAVCNMDWDRIRAIDLYTVFNSFKPPDSSLISVKIYPSEYGLKRMEEEKLKGPPELVEKTLNSDEEENLDDKKGGRYNREKLRQYQLNRLKYYYAVVDCDAPETANALYDHLNGMEYESSSVRFDLRFIPDDMTFDQEPSSVAENPDLTEYKPNIFVTTALQQVKVGLTWDETDPQRREIFQKAFTEPDDIEKNIKEYLASSSGDSELDEEVEDENSNVKLSTQERIQKYKALLESLNEQEKEKNEEKYEMEITWEPGIKEKTETLVKEKIEEQTSLTPFEELKKKKKEKQKMKKKEKNMKNKMEKIQNSESDASDLDSSIDFEADGFEGKNYENNNELYSKYAEEPEEINVRKSKKKKVKPEKSEHIQDELYLISDAQKTVETSSQKSKKKKKAKQKKVEDVEVDINDPRFSAIYTSPLFHIDPSDQHFKDTAYNRALIAEKQRRMKQGNSHENPQKKFKSK